jgi:hypothetical protein
MHSDLMSFKHETFHSTISSSQVSEMCFFFLPKTGVEHDGTRKLGLKHKIILGSYFNQCGCLMMFA